MNLWSADIPRYRAMFAWIPPLVRSEQDFGVFGHLFGCFKILVVNPAVFVFAFVCFVVATDIGPGLINRTEVVVPEHLALGVDKQVPVFLVEKDACFLMEQIPAHEIILAPAFRCFNWQSKIAATFGSAKLAKTRALRNKITFRFLRHHQLSVVKAG